MAGPITMRFYVVKIWTLRFGIKYSSTGYMPIYGANNGTTYGHWKKVIFAVFAVCMICLLPSNDKSNNCDIECEIVYCVCDTRIDRQTGQIALVAGGQTDAEDAPPTPSLLPHYRSLEHFFCTDMVD